MGRYTAFGDRFHLFGADLQFDTHTLRPDHRGMQRAIIIGLGRGNEIAEAFRHTAPGLVHNTERAIAVIRGRHDYAEGIDVGDLVKGLALALQLAPDRIGSLFTPKDAGLDSGQHQALPNGL